MAYKYPKGHPCEKCPYKFDVDKPSCTMGANPRDCVWRFYQRMNGHTEPIKEVQIVNPKITRDRINDCIEMLINVSEEKFGKAYAEKLRRDYI